MAKRWYHYTLDVMALCILGFLVYVGYFVFFDKPVTPEGIASLQLKLSYGFLALVVVQITRGIVKKR